MHETCACALNPIENSNRMYKQFQTKVKNQNADLTFDLDIILKGHQSKLIAMLVHCIYLHDVFYRSYELLKISRTDNSWRDKNSPFNTLNLINTQAFWKLIGICLSVCLLFGNYRWMQSVTNSSLNTQTNKIV